MLVVTALAAGGAGVVVANADPAPAALAASGTGTGLFGRYFTTMRPHGRPAATATGAVDLDLLGRGPVAGVGANHWSAVWTGELEVLETGDHTFTTTSDDGVRLWVNGTLVIDNWTDHSATDNSATVRLTAGTPARLRMEYYQDAGWATARLALTEPGHDRAVIPASRLFARSGSAPRGGKPGQPSPAPSPSQPAPSPSPSSSPSPAPKPAGKRTIMPIGDSLTAEPSWRIALRDQLRAQGHDVTMVGPKNDAGDGYAGFGGYTIDCHPTQVGNLADVVPGAVGDAKPTDALVLAGVNDWFNCQDTPKTDPDTDSPPRLMAMLDAAHAASPSTRFWVSSMLKTQFDADFGEHGFDQKVKALLADRPWATFVDLHHLVPLADGDWQTGGLHLTASGNAKLAKAWDGVLDPALGSAPVTPAPAPSTPAPGTGGDPASCATPSTTLTAALILGNEAGDHCGKLEGVPDGYSWALHPENGGKPVGDSMLTWGQVYPDAAGNPDTNAWVALRHAETWILSKRTGTWTRLQNTEQVEGAAFPEDFHGDAVTGPQRRDANGVLQVQAGNGRNFHFWAAGGSTTVPDMNDVAAIVSVVQGKLVDSSTAKYLLCTGVDYRSGGAAGQIVGSLGLGKCRYATPDWQYFTLSNATAEQLAAHPLPGLPRTAGD